MFIAYIFLDRRLLHQERKERKILGNSSTTCMMLALVLVPCWNRVLRNLEFQKNCSHNELKQMPKIGDGCLENLSVEVHVDSLKNKKIKIDTTLKIKPTE